MFDVSVILVALESVESFRLNYSNFLNISEWIITIVFSIEYISSRSFISAFLVDIKSIA